MRGSKAAQAPAPSRRRVPLLLACAGVLVAAGFAAGLPETARAQEPSPSVEARSTAATAVPPTATPSPPDATLAAAFARNGKLDEAIGAYLAAIDEGVAAGRPQARFELARVYIDAGNPSAAVRQLDAYLLEAPRGTDVRGAQFLLAEALSLTGRWRDAIALYDAYIDAHGGAATYARIGRAEALARLGRVSEANAEAGLVADAGPPAAERVAFVLTMAQALEGDHPDQAIIWYRRLGEESEAPPDDALALWRQAQLGGTLTQQSEAWQTIIESYPETAVAQQIVDEPPAVTTTAGVVDPYAVALVYYYAGRDGDARQAFESIIDAAGLHPSANRANAAYYLAVIDERNGEFADAVEGYSLVLAIDPQSERADDALWWRGRLEERIGRQSQARVTYEKLASEYGGRDWGREARFRLALLDYDAHRYDRAAAAFEAIADANSSVERQRALLWQGKALDNAGDREAATAVWDELRSAAQDEYYGLRAAVLLREAQGDLDGSAVGRQREPDWDAIDSWLDEKVGREAPALPRPLAGNAHWRLAQQLLALGMQRRADAELGLVLEGAGRDPLALFQLARAAHEAGVTHLSSRAAARLLTALPADVAAEAPVDLWRLAYPAPYAQVLRDAVDEADVPDLLLLAMVRQESFFDPLAGSSAGALGLTQVVPLTGETIARDLDVRDFETDDLFRPAVSLRFGAHYLAEQLDTFDGDIYQALAAYNAGPAAALRWARASGDDPDRFYAEIEFSQTKAYVQFVSENLARYRQLYEGLDAPSLPED